MGYPGGASVVTVAGLQRPVAASGLAALSAGCSDTVVERCGVGLVCVRRWGLPPVDRWWRWSRTKTVLFVQGQDRAGGNRVTGIATAAGCWVCVAQHNKERQRLDWCSARCGNQVVVRRLTFPWPPMEGDDQFMNNDVSRLHGAEQG